MYVMKKLTGLSSGSRADTVATEVCLGAASLTCTVSVVSAEFINICNIDTKRFKTIDNESDLRSVDQLGEEGRPDVGARPHRHVQLGLAAGTRTVRGLNISKHPVMYPLYSDDPVPAQ